MEIFVMILKLMSSLLIILGLIFILFKTSNKKINEINENKYINVIDRCQIAKDSYILIVKIGKEGYVMVSSGGKIEKLKNLSEDEITTIQKEKFKKIEEANIKYENAISKTKEEILKFKTRIWAKGDKYEE